MNAVLYLAHAVAIPLLLAGFIRRYKARLQNRIGPSILQPFWDAARLLRKRETVSSTTTPVFRAAPLVAVATALGAAAMLPWLGIAPPLPGDVFLFVYLLVLGKFAVGLAALDAGSAFGALGASREATVSIQTEPAWLLSLAALAIHARTASLSGLFAPVPDPGSLVLLVPLLVTALWLSAMAELARMPVDDPTTHLELTMIHEAMLLEYSGPSLALMEYAAALKMTVLLGLVGQTALLLAPSLHPWQAYLASLGMLGVGAAVIVVMESTLVKLRWRRIPNLLSFGLMASALACLLVAMKG